MFNVSNNTLAVVLIAVIVVSLIGLFTVSSSDSLPVSENTPTSATSSAQAKVSVTILPQPGLEDVDEGGGS